MSGDFTRAAVAVWLLQEDAVAAGTGTALSNAGLDNRHRNKNGEISGKHGNTLIRTLRKVSWDSHLQHKIANASR